MELSEANEGWQACMSAVRLVEDGNEQDEEMGVIPA